MSIPDNNPMKDMTSKELAAKMELVNQRRLEGNPQRDIDIELDKLKISQTDENLSNIKFRLSSKHWKLVIGILGALILISTISIFIPSSNDDIKRSNPSLNDILYPTVTPRNVTLPQFHATKNYTLNRIFGDLPNFRWKLTGIYTGKTYLAIQDPNARQNPAIPYYVEIDNTEKRSLFKFTSSECIQCLLTDISIQNNGSYNVIIEDNGIYNFERGEGVLNKISVPNIKSPIQQVGSNYVYTTGTEIVEINSLGELIWSWSPGDVINELATITDLLVDFNIIQVQRLGSNQYYALIQDTGTGIKLLIQIDKESKQITRKVLDNFGGLITNNPVSFLITANSILLYDANNIVYTSTLGRLNPFLSEAKIQKYSLNGEIVSDFTIRQIDGINLGPSLNSRIQTGHNGDLLILDPTNNRVAYLNLTTLESTFTIQGDGHIINGVSFIGR